MIQNDAVNLDAADEAWRRWIEHYRECEDCWQEGDASDFLCPTGRALTEVLEAYRED